MRLFRQTRPGDWRGVIERAAEALRRKEWAAGLFTAEARRTQSKEFLIKKYSDLCELGVSVVKIS
jgi:hypothetical protein